MNMAVLLENCLRLLWRNGRIILIILAVMSIIWLTWVVMFSEISLHTPITLHRDGINLLFEASSRSNVDETLLLNRSICAEMDEAQM
ncbi:unnamed protein product, partial [Hymenolepis diminuta]